MLDIPKVHCPKTMIATGLKSKPNTKWDNKRTAKGGMRWPAEF